MKYSFYDFHANYFISKNQCGSYSHTNQELAFHALGGKTLRVDHFVPSATPKSCQHGMNVCGLLLSLLSIVCQHNTLLGVQV